MRSTKTSTGNEILIVDRIKEEYREELLGILSKSKMQKNYEHKTFFNSNP